MARGRKPSKQRQRSRPGTAEAASEALGRPDPNGAPDPLEHSSGEVEIAEASIVADAPAADLRADEQLDSSDHEQNAPARRGRDGEVLPGRPGGDLPRDGNRFVNFLRACWAELQRVQWPDRKQVTQATGVVLGFVIIAGGYLGLADAIFSKLAKALL
jgi:preprotein translocase SecE subunit